MPDETLSASDSDAQSLLIKICIDCESPLPADKLTGRSSPRCESCRKVHRRRWEMERYYRLQGRDYISGAGSIGSCEDCGREIVKTRADNVVCVSCARGRLNLYNRTIRSAVRRASGVPVNSGVSIDCAKCGTSFEKNAWNQKYCSACKNEPRILYHKKRKSVDPKFALNSIVSSAIRKSLNRKKSGYSWESLVGYTIEDLMGHLERQFLPGMSWENRGLDGWVVDHIVPIASFEFDGPLDPEFKACWALTNLRPMWAPDNLAKKDKILYLI